MAETGIFGKIVNEILQATEHVAARMEEGVSVLLTGKLPGATNEGTNMGGEPIVPSKEDDLLMDEDIVGSPLEGIADSVLGDIISGQVSFTFVLRVLLYNS
jgi:hypothetical protein